MKPLFLPLNRKYYEAFMEGSKTKEYRIGKRWNDRTCPVGRAVTLSLGYGKQNRAMGVITSFRMVSLEALPIKAKTDMILLYKDKLHEAFELIAEIGIDVDR